MTDISGQAEAPAPEAASAEVSVAPEAIEAAASLAGWKPKREDWKDDGGEWEDAPTYLAKVKERTRALKDKVRASDDKAIRAIRASEKAVAAATKRIEADAEARIRQATKDGDEDAALEAAQDLAEARKPATGLIDAFKVENAWFETDDDATDLAVGVTQRMARKGASVAEQLAAAEAKVREKFPHLFGDEPAEKVKKSPPVLAPGAKTPSAPRAKGIADVPANVRAAWTPKYCRQFGMTLAELAEIYHEEQA